MFLGHPGHTGQPLENKDKMLMSVSFDLVAFDVISSRQIFLIPYFLPAEITIQFALKDDNFEVNLICDSCF